VRQFQHGLSGLVFQGSEEKGKLKSRMSDIFKSHIWSFPVHVGLLLVVLMSGCKSGSQPPANADTNAVNGVKSASTSVSDGDTGSGRSRSRSGRADTQAAPGAFDFYLLNLSWSPEFCATHEGSSECGRGLGFVVHGLWPQDASGDYPENCSDAPGPANPQAYTDIIPTVSLVEHEWQTHGTCSGLKADAYFAAARSAFTGLKIPADIGTGGDAAGVTPAQLLERFAKANAAYPAGSIALSCGNNRLTAIEVCLRKDLQPESCQGVRSCRANVIKVTPR
jgi:ribonuclease T2